MPKVLSIKLLGGVEVCRNDGRSFNFSYDKVKALLAYLLVEPPTPRNRDVLAGTFWPEQPEESARHSLRQALMELRKVTGDGRTGRSLLLITRSAIQRNALANVDLDVASFEACSEGPDPDVAALERAAALYRGEFLAGLSTKDTEVFTDWLEHKREHYRNLTVTVLDRLMRHYETTRDLATACRYARNLLALEPWREETHRRLMEMLARLGQRAAALRQFRLCDRQLRQAFDVAPEVETERLRRRIEAMGKTDEDLPPVRSRLVGRERELDTLESYLSDPTRRLITITGLGGVGKSRLALEVGCRLRDGDTRRFLHGVSFVNLAAVATVDHLVAELARRLGLELTAGRPARDQLLGQLRERESLLILDNFEHLVIPDVTNLVSALLEAAPGIRLLVTSRQSLGLQAEQRLLLAGLHVPATIPLNRRLGTGHQSVGTAVQLFLETMQRRSDRATPAAHKLGDVLWLCRAVEGMPLGIELAAAWVDRLSLFEVRRQVEQSLDVLATAAPDVPERHRSIRAVFDASCRRLSEADRRTLLRLSVFSGGFTREAADAVAGADPRALARLAGHSLLQSEVGGNRHHLHELLRQFAGERLGPEELNDALDKHSAHYSSQLERLEPELQGDLEPAALQRIDDDFDNIQRAWQHAIEHGATDRVDQSAPALHHYLMRRTRFTEARTLFEGVIEKLEAHRAAPASQTRARLLAFEGDILAETGQRERALACLQEFLALSDSYPRTRKELRREQALAWHRLAWLTDDAQLAHSHHERSLRLYRQLNDPSRVASVLADLGYLWKSAGELEKAEACFVEGLEVRRTLRTPGLAAELSFHLGELRARQGRFHESLRVFRDGLRMARAAADPARELRGLASMSTTYLHIGAFQQGEAQLRRTIRLQQQLGYAAQLPETLFFLGWSLVFQGKYPEARRCGEQILERVAEGGPPPMKGLARSILGAALLGEHQPAQARDLLERAVDELATGWQVDWQGRRAGVLSVLACCQCHLQDPTAARQPLLSALRVAVEVRSMIGTLMSLPVVALFWLTLGNASRAQEVRRIALAQPLVARSHWYQEIMDRPFVDAHLPRPKERRSTADDTGPPDHIWAAAERMLADLLGHSRKGSGTS